MRGRTAGRDLRVAELYVVLTARPRSLRSGGEPPPVAQRPEPVQCLALDLATALLADPDPRADLGVRLRFCAVQSVAAQQDLTMAGRQHGEHRPGLPVVLALLGVLPWVSRPPVGAG